MFQSYVLNNNDELRNYLQYINGGSWPTLQVNGQTLYVQPYIDSHRSNSSGDIIIYASRMVMVTGILIIFMIQTLVSGGRVKNHSVFQISHLIR